MLGALGWAYVLAGRAQEAQKLLAELRAQDRTSHVPPMAMAWIYVGLGDVEGALEWLGRAVDERDPPILGLGAEPMYNWLRPAPRCRALLKKMNLEG